MDPVGGIGLGVVGVLECKQLRRGLDGQIKMTGQEAVRQAVI